MGANICHCITKTAPVIANLEIFTIEEDRTFIVARQRIVQEWLAIENWQ